MSENSDDRKGSAPTLRYSDSDGEILSQNVVSNAPPAAKSSDNASTPPTNGALNPMPASPLDDLYRPHAASNTPSASGTTAPNPGIVRQESTLPHPAGPYPTLPQAPSEDDGSPLVFRPNPSTASPNELVHIAPSSVVKTPEVARPSATPLVAAEKVNLPHTLPTFSREPTQKPMPPKKRDAAVPLILIGIFAVSLILMLVAILLPPRS